MLIKIISGGQTGTDQAALQAAIDSGVPHGGWCPPGRVCESGKIPKHFLLKKTPVERSELAPEVPRSLRTEWNVRDSDGTLIFSGGSHDPGTTWTLKAVTLYQKPSLIISGDQSAERVSDWLKEKKIRVLNVAGPSEKNTHGIYEKVYNFISDLIKRNS